MFNHMGTPSIWYAGGKWPHASHTGARASLPFCPQNIEIGPRGGAREGPSAHRVNLAKLMYDFTSVWRGLRIFYLR